MKLSARKRKVFLFKSRNKFTNFAFMHKEEIAGYYDVFSATQVKTGANERLISLYKRLLEQGLKSSSNVLELGCGVGNFTKLLAEKVTSGKIEAVDFSQKSIEIARKKCGEKQNIHFEVADVTAYTPKFADFDFITLMDVIEHIPLEKHQELFSKICRFSTEKTLIALNIPNPEYIAFTRKNQPETLQVIDQEIHLAPLLTILENSGLELVFFEKYSIWEIEDYHFLLVRKKQNFELRHLSDERTLSEKVLNKVSRKIDSLKYR
ncbi:class I SAM-dependent methyltransferase [Kaistella solincola]|nr:class I SAM-dependent methyltransferase [Kaistella solincola]